MSRVKLVQMSNSYSNKAKFPYTADDLALYMYSILNSEEIKDLDTEVTQLSESDQEKPDLVEEIQKVRLDCIPKRS